MKNCFGKNLIFKQKLSNFNQWQTEAFSMIYYLKEISSLSM